MRIAVVRSLGNRVPVAASVVLFLALSFLAPPSMLASTPGDEPTVTLVADGKRKAKRFLYALEFKATETCEVLIGGQNAGVLKAGEVQTVPVPKKGEYVIDARSTVDGARWMRHVEVKKVGANAVEIDFDAARKEHEEVSRLLAEGKPLILGLGDRSITIPRIIEESKVLPEYPVVDLKLNRPARVFVQVIIEADGRVTNPKVVSADPDEPRFKDAAVAAVTKWRYEPARYHGEAVPVTFAIGVHFNIEENLPAPRDGEPRRRR